MKATKHSPFTRFFLLWQTLLVLLVFSPQAEFKHHAFAKVSELSGLDAHVETSINVTRKNESNEFDNKKNIQVPVLDQLLKDASESTIVLIKISSYFVPTFISQHSPYLCSLPPPLNS